MPEGMQYDMLRLTIIHLKYRLKINFLLTFISFILLCLFVFFVQMHPKSVWYYFCSGFFLKEMISRIIENTDLKYLLKDAVKRLESIGKPSDY